MTRAQSPANTSAAPSGRRSLLWLTVFALAGAAILCSLGVWQLRRLEWKLGIIARMEQRMHAPAVALPPETVWEGLAEADSEYRKYRLRGVFEHGKEALIFRAANPGSLGPGYQVLTPLRLADGSRVIVNRGFVPENLRDPAKRLAGQVSGEVTITGVLRKPEDRNSFTPPDKPAEKLWYTRDPLAIARAYGMERAAPFTIDADANANPGGWPRGAATQIRIRNDHLSYALTWFGLAATLLAVYAAFVWQRLKMKRIR
ncbi:MAG: SURF1 family protein [Beijerinckiaceae bacterium]